MHSQKGSLLYCITVLIVTCIRGVVGQASRPGGAGHALLFRDHGILLENFRDIGRDALTFEAWISTSDFCHASAVLSYARMPSSSDEAEVNRASNHFVIFDPRHLVACHDFQYIDLWPDPGSVSCMAAFNHSRRLPSYVERDGRWHHLAVTWSTAARGTTKVYWDGLLTATAISHKVEPLVPGGALMLGAEQDCYGGCTDAGQGFYGLLDEVRIWRTERTQAQILENMRAATGVEKHTDLAAYWKFDDPDDVGVNKPAMVAHDASGRGNDLRLITPPQAALREIKRAGASLNTGALSFKNSYAMCKGFGGMPEGDITVEFWARTPTYAGGTRASDGVAGLFSFSAFEDDGTDRTFLSDAIMISRYMTEFSDSAVLNWQKISTRGSVSVRINANRKDNGRRHTNWIDFQTAWTDGEWHHIAVTWQEATGDVQLYFDGRAQLPFLRASAGSIQVRDPAHGGVDHSVGRGIRRSGDGSLVLGQVQECYGGCLSPQNAMHGEIADLRIWDRVRSREETVRDMGVSEPASKDGLRFKYTFRPEDLYDVYGKHHIPDAYSPFQNSLYLASEAPQWVYSTAPLVDGGGVPVAPPTAGLAGHALRLSDQQVLILKDFQDFPDREVTLEFWMLSTDTCRAGTPFSYAHGEYSKGDNAFLVFDYNNWGVSVMEDEGTRMDHKSGVTATDGRWHHIAVTWRSSDGIVTLYDNGDRVWSVERGRGRRIPSGGTLVVGREQDCEGGCFDSRAGAAGDVQDVQDQEYGPQDFFGLIDDMRLWKRARSAEEIRHGMRSSLEEKGSGSGAQRGTRPVDVHDPDLVAYWNFDEGRGFMVHDATGHGHDLLATQPTQWEVVRWLAVCGNGVVEGLEECDDGGESAGDGCSAECKIEKGWDCTKTSPSRCWRVKEGTGGSAPRSPTPAPVRPSPRGDGVAPGAPAGGEQPHQARGDSGGDEPRGDGRVLAGFVGAGVALTLVAGLAAGLALARRGHLRGAAGSAMDSLRQHLLPRRTGAAQHADEGGLDMDAELELAPEFTDFSMGRDHDKARPVLGV